jgi:hypothetical protein
MAYFYCEVTLKLAREVEFNYTEDNAIFTKGIMKKIVDSFDTVDGVTITSIIIVPNSI